MLTTQQLQIIKAEILADPILNAFPLNSDGHFAIAALLNQIFSPSFIVWRTSVTIKEIMTNNFRWTDIDTLTAAKYRTWEQFVWLGEINPSKPNIRQGLRDCWGAGSAQEVVVLPHLKRSASRVEKILASGTGTDAIPATMTFEGPIPYNEVEAARNI